MQLEQQAAGHANQFARLKEFLAREVEPGEYEAVAQHLGQTTNSIAASVRRLRLRLRELAIGEAAKTTATLAEAEAELRALFG